MTLAKQYFYIKKLIININFIIILIKYIFYKFCFIKQFYTNKFLIYYQVNNFNTTTQLNVSLNNLHFTKLIRKKKKKNPLGVGVPQARGIVLKTLIKHPKKPNSANRK